MPKEAYKVYRPVYTTPVLDNFWVNYGLGYSDVGYYKDQFGVVRIRGLVEDGEATTLPAQIFLLPEGFRPPANKIFIASASTADESSYTWAAVQVYSTGSVSLVAHSGGGTGMWVSLDGISFTV